MLAGIDSIYGPRGREYQTKRRRRCATETERFPSSSPVGQHRIGKINFIMRADPPPESNTASMKIAVCGVWLLLHRLRSTHLFFRTCRILTALPGEPSATAGRWRWSDHGRTRLRYGCTNQRAAKLISRDFIALNRHADEMTFQVGA